MSRVRRIKIDLPSEVVKKHIEVSHNLAGNCGIVPISISFGGEVVVSSDKAFIEAVEGLGVADVDQKMVKCIVKYADRSQE